MKKQFLAKVYQREESIHFALKHKPLH